MTAAASAAIAALPALILQRANPGLYDMFQNALLQAQETMQLATKADLYEYMLSKIATAGQNGQFRTPRHIIKMMVELTAPTPKDVICDPACGTCGYLVAAAEYLETNHKDMLRDKKQKEHFHHHMFHGSDFDSSMLRIGAMNMTLHGIDNPSIETRDSLSEDHADKRNAYTLILANPPFKGSLDSGGTDKVWFYDMLAEEGFVMPEKQIVISLREINPLLDGANEDVVHRVSGILLALGQLQFRGGSSPSREFDNGMSDLFHVLAQTLRVSILIGKDGDLKHMPSSLVLIEEEQRT